MELKPDFVFRPLPQVEHLVHFPFPTLPNPLGPLAQLAGTWGGKGFNVIWRPHFPASQSDRFLELNLTDDQIQFDAISGAIPNRGLLQNDINMFGLTYLQQISDANLHAGLHIEPGIWATVPATTNPAESPTVVRMASIPHGTTILAQGTATTAAGPPNIPNDNILPFVIGNPANTFNFPEQNLATPSPFRSPPPQLVGITQAMVNNPNSVLQAALVGHTILSTTTLHVSTVPANPLTGGGTDNTAFLVGGAGGPNAVSAAVSATFWIETVKGNPNFLQLQYTQLVLLNFNGLSWPHVTVATLRKAVPVSVPIWRVDPDIPRDVLAKAEAATPAHPGDLVQGFDATMLRSGASGCYGEHDARAGPAAAVARDVDAVRERADERVGVVRRLGAHVVGRERPRAQAVGAVDDHERAIVPVELQPDLRRGVRDAVGDELAEHGFGGVEIARGIRVLLEIVAERAAHARGVLRVGGAQRPAARVGLDHEMPVVEGRQGSLTVEQHTRHLLNAVPAPSRGRGRRGRGRERRAEDMPSDRRRSLRPARRISTRATDR
jgi:hypothetical protein